MVGNLDLLTLMGHYGYSQKLASSEEARKKMLRPHPTCTLADQTQTADTSDNPIQDPNGYSMSAPDHNGFKVYDVKVTSSQNQKSANEDSLIAFLNQQSSATSDRSPFPTTATTTANGNTSTTNKPNNNIATSYNTTTATTTCNDNDDNNSNNNNNTNKNNHFDDQHTGNVSSLNGIKISIRDVREAKPVFIEPNLVAEERALEDFMYVGDTEFAIETHSEELGGFECKHEPKTRSMYQAKEKKDRQYFHSATFVPITYNPFEGEDDSEDDVDDSWATEVSAKMMDEIHDLNGGEKTMMKLWNYYLDYESGAHTQDHFHADNNAFSLCTNFIKKYAKTLVHLKLQQNYKLHLTCMLDFGLLRAAELKNLLFFLDATLHERL